MVAPEFVKIYTFPDFPDYSVEDGVSWLDFHYAFYEICFFKHKALYITHIQNA